MTMELNNRICNHMVRYRSCFAEPVEMSELRRQLANAVYLVAQRPLTFSHEVSKQK